MKRTVINIMGCILTCFAIIMLLTADMFSIAITKESYYGGNTVVVEGIKCNFTEFVFEISELNPYVNEGVTAPLETIGLLMIILLAATAIIALLKCFSPIVKELEKLATMKMLVIIPIIAIVLSVLLLIMSAELKLEKDYFLVCSPELMFYFYIILLVMVVICDILAHAKSIESSETKNVAFGKKASVNAESLKQYKELLDSGAITAEEYEEMKKQILNL